MFDIKSIGGNLIVGDTVHIDPRKLLEIVIVSEQEANAIAEASPKREFIVSWGNKSDGHSPG